MSVPTDMHFQQPGKDSDRPTEPRASVIEVVERHPGGKHPETGLGSLLCPNHLRINGVGVYGTYDHPVAVEEIEVSDPHRPFSVTVRLLARALRVGVDPTALVPAEGGDVASGVVVEIPDVDHDLVEGDQLERPYVYVNGLPVYVAGAVTIGRMGSHTEQDIAMVSLPLLCRRLLVDDEPT